MAAVDISLNEVAGAAPHEELSMMFGMSVVEGGTFVSAVSVNPTITNVTPVGGKITSQQAWGARLSLSPDDGTIIRTIIMVEYTSGASEEACIDGVFAPDYTGKSTMVQSSPGVFDISMIRNGGWPSSPRIRLHANTDRGGMTQ